MPAKPAKNQPPVLSPAPARGKPPEPPTLSGWLFPGYVALIFLGFFALRLPGAMMAGEEMGPVRALFTAVNAGTLTGFPQITEIDKYQPLGQATIFTLVVAGTLITLIIGGCAVTRILRLGYTETQIALAALAAEVVAIAGGGFFLLFDQDRTVAQAAFLAASAFGNCGLIIGVAPGATSWQTLLILIPLMFAGGIGICVLMEIADLFRHKTFRLSYAARTALTWSAWIYAGATVLLVLFGLWAAAASDAPFAGSDMRDLIATSATSAIASRTAGLRLVDVQHLSRPALWLIMLLMAAGASSASAGGGIKTTTIAELFRGVRRSLRGEAAGRTMGIAACWVAIYTLLVTIALLVLLHALPEMPPEQVLFHAISAASNVGLAPEALDPGRLPAYVLCATMLIGRFGPLMVLWWMADTTKDAEMVVG
jgi:Trk-type K+ transport system membrane component